MMIYAMIDNIIIFTLCLVTVLGADLPILLIITAGLFVVMVTADSLEFRLYWVKAAFCIAFAVLSNSWIGFLAFTVLWPGVIPLLIAVPGILYAIYALCLQAGDVSAHFAASTFLLSLAVMAGNALLLLLKEMIRKELAKKETEQARLRSFAISEMREKKLNRQLAQQNYLVDKNARLTERENISRNIHNSVGHTITAAIMTLDAADMLYDVKPEEARKKMNDANERIRGSLESIRRAVRTLDEESKDVPVTDLIAGLQNIIEEFTMDTARRCDFKTESFPEGMQIPHEHMEFLTGVLEELLTNGVKHGQADSFLINLTGDSGHLQLIVKDNGRSDYNDANAAKLIENGFGLKKIISYAERCGGQAGFRNEDGFRASIELPVPQNT